LKNLVLSSILLILFIGCSYSHFKDFQRIPEAEINKDSIRPWFGRDTNRFLFRAHIDFYRNHLGGLMLIKPYIGTGYRVLFITEVGIKIFDMELKNNGDFIMHYCMEELNRKSVLKTLKNDIGLMLNSIPENTRTKLMKDRQNGNILIKTKDKTGVKYYFLEDHCRVKRIVQKNGWINKVNLTIYNTDPNTIDSIHICHSPVKLGISLSLLNERQTNVAE
jgi:hypothetical protein